MQLNQLIAIGLLGCSLFHCSSSTSPAPAAAPESEAPTLKSAFADDFRMGAALNAATFTGQNEVAAELVAREFNTITPENDMKWGPIQPTRDSFNWGPADAFVDYGEKHDMWIVGHALVWYQQIGDYVGEITDPDEMRAVLREHINAVAGRYKGRVDAWDVLNEAIDDAGEGALRSWPVADVLGPDYVTEIFKMAREAAPDAELY